MEVINCIRMERVCIKNYEIAVKSCSKAFFCFPDLQDTFSKFVLFIGFVVIMWLLLSLRLGCWLKCFVVFEVKLVCEMEATTAFFLGWQRAFIRCFNLYCRNVSPSSRCFLFFLCTFLLQNFCLTNTSWLSWCWQVMLEDWNDFAC